MLFRSVELRREVVAMPDKIHTVPRDTKLCAVVPIVIYWGLKPWDGPTTLHDMLKPAGRKLLPLIPNYTFTMVEPVKMPVKQIRLLKTDLGAVFLAIRSATDKKRLRKLVQTDKRFKNLDYTAAWLLNELLNLKLKMQSDDKEKVNMCQAWQEILEDERNAGRDAARDEYEPKLRLLASENETIKSKYATVQSENETIKSENETIKSENETIKTKYETVQSENETIKSENETYRTKIENVRNNLRAQGLSEDEISALFDK